MGVARESKTHSALAAPHPSSAPSGGLAPFPAALLYPMLYNSRLEWSSWPCLAPQAMSVGICCQQGDQLHMGQPQPTWDRVGSGAGVGPWLLPHGPNPVCSISSLSLGASPEPASWDEADFAEREGHGWMGCWRPHTSHLPTLALGTWSLLSMVGQGHPGHQTQGQGPGSCLCLPLQFISTPAFSPS